MLMWISLPKSCQQLWDATEGILRGTFITIDAYIKKQEGSQIENLILHLKQLEEEKQMKPRIGRRNEIRKSRNKWLETQRGIENISETKPKVL